jgi:hypothetical protein
MSEKKTIQINPDLFKISNKSNTRKKNTDKPPKIELKSSIKTQKQKTLRKNVLEMIREKQQEAYRDLFDKKKAPSSSNTSSKDKTEFDKWKKGLDNLAKDAVKRKTEKTLRIEIDIMIDTTLLYRILQNRISRLIPLGLGNIWVKLKGDNAFNLAKILGFTFNEWKYLMDATGVISGNRIYPTKLKNLSGLLYQSVRFDTYEIEEKTIWLKFSFANDMVSLHFFEIKAICQYELKINY